MRAEGVDTAGVALELRVTIEAHAARGHGVNDGAVVVDPSLR